MKKFLILLLFIVPLSSFTLEEKIPAQYIYVGFLPKVGQVKSVLKKMINPGKYRLLEQMVAFRSRKTIGFDIINEPISRLGIEKNSYVEMMLSPKKSDFMIKFSKGNPSILLRKFQSLLKKKWRSIKTSSSNGVSYFSTNNPRYRSARVFYKLNSSSLVLATSVKVLAGQVSFKIIASTLHTKAKRFIKRKRPLMYVFISKEFFTMASRALALLVNDMFLFFGSDSKSLWVSSMMEKKGYQEVSLPRFIKNTPVFLLNGPINERDLKNFQNILKRRGMGGAFGSVNMKEIFGNQLFFTLEDFNFIELMQGIYQNMSIGFGLKLKKSDVMIGLFEMGLMQVRSSYGKGRKSVYRGAPLYIFENIPSSAGGKSLVNLYCVIFKDYLFAHTKLNELKAMADRYKNGVKSLRLPTRSKGVVLFLDFIELFKRLPLVKNRIKSYGINIDNLNYFETHYKVLSDSILHGTMVLKFK